MADGAQVSRAPPCTPERFAECLLFHPRAGSALFYTDGHGGTAAAGKGPPPAGAAGAGSSLPREPRRAVQGRGCA